jgi:hypothetical protein
MGVAGYMAAFLQKVRITGITSMAVAPRKVVSAQ